MPNRMKSKKIMAIFIKSKYSKATIRKILKATRESGKIRT